MSKVVILHSDTSEDTSLDEADVLVQVRAVHRALAGLGYEPIALAFSMDIERSMSLLQSIRPAFVFNLVETMKGSGRLIHVAPAFLEEYGWRYTGSGLEALFQTSNKIAAKRILRMSGIPTPHWFTMRDALGAKSTPRGRYIIKSVWEHASIGLDETSVISIESPEHLIRELCRRRDKLGGDCFAERFVEGREFNLSLLAGKAGPQVLPPAEIRFDGFPASKLRMVDYQAKWDSDSFEYKNTRRVFDFALEDYPLLTSLKRVAEECWHIFELRGYARVDLRVDGNGRPWVLEVNANPCLSPDAGFMAAAKRAGLDLGQVVERILEDLPCRSGKQSIPKVE